MVASTNITTRVIFGKSASTFSSKETDNKLIYRKLLEISYLLIFSMIRTLFFEKSRQKISPQWRDISDEFYKNVTKKRRSAQE